MKAVIPVVFIVLLAGVAVGQKTQPDPPVAAIVQSGEEIPTPSGTPEPQGAPELLPESSRLPAAPPDLRLPAPSILKPEGANSIESPQGMKPLSPEEEARNKARLAEIRQIAMRNPRVNDLLRQANGALMDEALDLLHRAWAGGAVAGSDLPVTDTQPRGVLMHDVTAGRPSSPTGARPPCRRAWTSWSPRDS